MVYVVRAEAEDLANHQEMFGPFEALTEAVECAYTRAAKWVLSSVEGAEYIVHDSEFRLEGPGSLVWYRNYRGDGYHGLIEIHKLAQ